MPGGGVVPGYLGTCALYLDGYRGGGAMVKGTGWVVIGGVGHGVDPNIAR